MNEHGYSNEQQVQILIALLKTNNIRKIIVSPGATNITFVGSVQYDSFFELYSCVDERSAAYMACGLAEESGETVCLSCTGATASRNYMPGLTEAYYRKLPVLAITASQYIGRSGQLSPQFVDRSQLPKDVVKYSVTLPIVNNDQEFWDCRVKVNTALLELNRNGGGPVHINLQTTYSPDNNFRVMKLPLIRSVKRIMPYDPFPQLPNGKIAIFIGSHKKMNAELQESIDIFCEKNNSIVLCDHTSGYYGKYSVHYALVACQKNLEKLKPDFMIHLGEITGDYYTKGIVRGNEVWRVSEDGEVRDLFARLTHVFEMPETLFFHHYADHSISSNDSYLKACQKQLSNCYKKLPKLPFSNIWIASQTAPKLPENSMVYLGILNTLRAWNFFPFPEGVHSTANVGGFGIDGGLSTCVGASIANKNKIFYAILGDLAFFYDMNSIGNRHIGNNLRIILINNGKGTEFRNYNHLAARFSDSTDEFIAAAGHFGNKSSDLVRHYSKDLGFEYHAVHNKAEYLSLLPCLTAKTQGNQPIIVEVFTDSEKESEALKKIHTLYE